VVPLFTTLSESPSEHDELQKIETQIRMEKTSGPDRRFRESRGGHGMPNVDGDNLDAPASRQFENLDVFAVRKGAEKQETREINLDHCTTVGSAGRRRTWPPWTSPHPSLSALSVSLSLLVSLSL
jgi:hypothetical protein